MYESKAVDVKIYPNRKESKVNPLAPGECGFNFKCVILKHIFVINITSIFCKINLTWLPRDLVVVRQHWLRQLFVTISYQANTCWPKR